MDREGKDIFWNQYFEPLILENQNVEYRGFWTKDRKTITTLGEMRFGDGSLYRGKVEDNDLNGRGLLNYTDGNVYLGMFRDGRCNGYGIFFDQSDNSIYKGEWINDTQHGYGEEYWDDKEVLKYEGNFVRGNKTGQGRLELKNGDFYQGDFIDGTFQG